MLIRVCSKASFKILNNVKHLFPFTLLIKHYLYHNTPQYNIGISYLFIENVSILQKAEMSLYVSYAKEKYDAT